ncbi:hypothetical protein [uncultured Alistipes sp.]|uniref:hypothetical protein n=1 Tax=uncultured Alistipes sp. TaxID=538949 RepID=UPI001F9B1831|nr:hypothetical protein [uncultured Alistipes sp.]HJC26612.1 hypothetical protein [Candidatus Alistipes stercoravium]
MTANKGYTIEVSSRYGEWWRYNVELMCGCFDAAEQRTGFASAASEVADVGANLTERPADISPARTVKLTTEPCDHLVLYIYVIPHTLPRGNDIDATAPFEIEIRIACDGRRILTEKRRINQWSGASIEMRVAHGE